MVDTALDLNVFAGCKLIDYGLKIDRHKRVICRLLEHARGYKRSIINFKSTIGLPTV